MYVKTILLSIAFAILSFIFFPQKVEAISLDELPPLPHELPFNQSGHTYTEYVIWHAENDNVYLMYYTPDSSSITTHYTFGINSYLMPGVGGFNINYILS